MIGAPELARLPRDAYVLNLARGGVVAEDALADALRAGRIAGAALDVFDHEPLPADHPLRGVPNLVLTPHLGASTRDAQRNVAIEACEAVRDALVTGDLSAAMNATSVGGAGMRRAASAAGAGRPAGPAGARAGAGCAHLAGGALHRRPRRGAAAAAAGRAAGRHARRGGAPRHQPGQRAARGGGAGDRDGVDARGRPRRAGGGDRAAAGGWRAQHPRGRRRAGRDARPHHPHRTRSAWTWRPAG